ncbi:unnamed protein product [Caenorhabditis brenneri]
MSFPLFRLPYLAIIQVFKNMSHETLFLLSISTKKAKNYIKKYLPKQFLTADFHLCQLIKVIPPDNGPGHFRIYGFCTVDWPKKAIRCSIGNHLAAVYLTMGQIDFYWSRSDFKFIISSFISQIYICWNCPKISVTFNGRYSFQHFSILTEELKRNNLGIESMYFLRNESYDEKLIKFLVECPEITSKLVIDSEIDDFFENRHPRSFIQVKEFEIKNCSWVYLEDFMECKSIRVEFVNARNNFGVYINTFIQKWFNDVECPLEVITITNCSFAFEQITNGFRKPSSHSVAGISLKVQRNDGKHILITLIENILKMELIE